MNLENFFLCINGENGDMPTELTQVDMDNAMLCLIRLKPDMNAGLVMERAVMYIRADFVEVIESMEEFHPIDSECDKEIGLYRTMKVVINEDLPIAEKASCFGNDCFDSPLCVDGVMVTLRCTV